jgi:hypothetical protein
MKLETVVNVVQEYMNRAFKLYQAENEFEVNFSNWCNIVFKWDENNSITKVTFFTSHGDYEGTTDEHFDYALDFIRANSEIIIRYKSL